MGENVGTLNRESIRGDEYYTLEHDVEVIADNLVDGLKIWLPFNDKGKNFEKILTDRGFEVICTDSDFFQTDIPDGCNAIVSNPPFSKKKDVLKRCDWLGIKFALILPFLFLNDGVPLDYGNQIMLYRKRMYFIHKESGELNKPRTNCFVLSNCILKEDFKIVR